MALCSAHYPIVCCIRWRLCGPTAGGIKIIRVLMIYLQGMREVKRLIHPNGVFTIKMGRNAVSDRLVDAVWSFSAFMYSFSCCPYAR